MFPRRDAGKPHQSQSTTNPNAPSSTNPISRNDPAESVPSLFQSQIPPPSTSGTPVHPSASSSTQIMPRVTPTPAAAPLSHEPTRPSEGANANVPQIQTRVPQKTNLASTSSAFVSSPTHSSSPSSSHASSDHLGSQAAHSPAPAISAQARMQPPSPSGGAEFLPPPLPRESSPSSTMKDSAPPSLPPPSMPVEIPERAGSRSTIGGSDGMLRSSPPSYSSTSASSQPSNSYRPSASSPSYNAQFPSTSTSASAPPSIPDPPSAANYPALSSSPKPTRRVASTSEHPPRTPSQSHSQSLSSRRSSAGSTSSAGGGRPNFTFSLDLSGTGLVVPAGAVSTSAVFVDNAPPSKGDELQQHSSAGLSGSSSNHDYEPDYQQAGQSSQIYPHASSSSSSTAGSLSASADTAPTSSASVDAPASSYLPPPPNPQSQYQPQSQPQPQASPSAPAGFIDTPIPGFHDIERARASASHNYFSSNPVGIDRDPDGDGNGEAGSAAGARGGEGAAAFNGMEPVAAMFFDEEHETLGYLEKLFLFTMSQAVFHRVFIARSLPEYLAHVSPADAVTYVLPRLNALGTDQDESVREAFVAELVPVMWWFFVNCELVEGALDVDELEAQELEHEHDGALPPAKPKLHVSSFTPLLGPLLLNSNALVAEVARNCVVELLRRAVVGYGSGDGEEGSLSEEGRGMLERELIDGVIIGLARLGLGGEEELDYSEQQEYDQGAEAGGFEQHGPSSPGPSIVPAPLGLDSSLASSAAPAPPAPTTSSLPTPSHSSIRTPPTHIDIPPEISTSSPTPSPPTFIPSMSSSSSATPGSVTSPGIASIRSLATDRSTPSLSAGNSVSSESEYSLRTAASPSASGGYDNVVVRNPFDVAAERHLSFPFNGSQSSEELVGEGAIGPTDGSVRGSASPLSTMSSSSGSTTTPSPLSPFSPAAPPVSRRSTDSVRSPPLETIEETEGSTPPLDSLVQAAGLSNRNLMASPWDDGGITPTVEKDRSDIFSSTFTPKLGSTAELEEPSTEPVINPTVSIPHISNIAPGHSVPFISSPGQPENNNELSVTTSSPPPVPDDTSSNASVRARTASAPSPSTSSSAASALPDAAPTSSSSVSIAEASTSQPPATDESNARAEEAAMGCVASMSLIAAVAASGHIPEDAKAMFVAEVARVGSDPLFWVRREAAYALGALTKVVDEEMLLDYLVPLYSTFVDDSAWQVRQSSLFALPPILSRVSPEDRRKFALLNYAKLTQDKSRSVRLAMLEILGEVIYTFAEDPEGPPAELLEIFVGNPRAGYRLDPPPLPPSAATAASRLAHSQSAPSTPSARPKSKRGLLARDSSLRLPPPDPETSGVDPVPDLDRPLICAFNFPAVALTVGRERWHEVSGYYAQLAKEYVFTRAELTEGANVLSQFQRQVNAKKVGKVRRTIAASLGEMARILGEDITHEQLLPIFWEALYARPPAASVPMSGESRFSATSGQSGGVGADQNATPFGLSRLGSGKASPPNMTATSATPFATVSAVGVSAHNLVTAAAEAEAEDARTKMLECLVLFVKHLGSRERVEVARGLETAWKDHVKGWREREVFARTFGGLCEPGALGYDSSESSTSTSGPETMRALIMLALTDNVAAVRDEAIAQLPACFEGLDVDHTIVGKKLREDVLDLARTGSFRRRATYVKCLQALVLSERWGKHELARSDIWDMLQRLGTDSITDVRIGAARLTSLIAYQHYPTRRYPPGLLSLIRTLRNDKSPEVSSFVRFLVVAVPLPPTPGHAFSPTPRHQSAAVNDDQADPLSLADFQQPMVLPVLREPVASPFATFSNPPFFGEVTSPSLSTDGGEEYFDAFDSFPFQPMLAAVSEDAALASSGSPAHGQTATEHDVHSSVAPTPHLVGSGAPALTTQDAEEDEDPAPPRAERPPIYRLWSY